MATSLFKKAWNKITNKSVGDDMNIDMHLIKLEMQKIDALQKDDWEKVATIQQEIKYWEGKRGIKKDRRSDVLEELEDIYNKFGDDVALLREIAKENGCSENEAQVLVSEFLKKKTKYDKDVNVAVAGPVPKSGLAAQDLEGDSSTTKSKTPREEQIKKWKKEGKTRQQVYSLLKKEGVDVGTIESWLEEYFDKSQVKKAIDKFLKTGYFEVTSDYSEKGGLNDMPDAKDPKPSIPPNEYDVSVGTSFMNEDGHKKDSISQGRNAAKREVVLRVQQGQELEDIIREVSNKYGLDEWEIKEMMPTLKPGDPRKMIKSAIDNFLKTCVAPELPALLQDEKEGAEKYHQLAEETSNSEIAEVLESMAEDESHHFSQLKEIEAKMRTGKSQIKKGIETSPIDVTFHGKDKPKPNYTVEQKKDSIAGDYFEVRVNNWMWRGKHKPTVKMDLTNDGWHVLVKSQIDIAKSINSFLKGLSDDQAMELLMAGEVDKLRRKLVVEDGLSREDANEKIRQLRSKVMSDDKLIREHNNRKEKTMKSRKTTPQDVRRIAREKIKQVSGLSSLLEEILNVLDKEGKDVQDDEMAAVRTIANEVWNETHKSQKEKWTEGGPGSSTFGSETGFSGSTGHGDMITEDMYSDSTRSKSNRDKNMNKQQITKDETHCPQEGCGGHIVWVKGVPICTNSAQAKALLSGGKLQTVEKEILPVNRPKQPLYNVRDKDVLTWAKDCLEQNNSEEIARRLISEEFGFSNSEVSEVLSYVIGAVEPDKNDGRKLDPHSVQGKETSVGSENYEGKAQKESEGEWGDKSAKCSKCDFLCTGKTEQEVTAKLKLHESKHSEKSQIMPSLSAFKDALNGRIQIHKSKQPFRTAWDRITKAESAIWDIYGPMGVRSFSGERNTITVKRFSRELPTTDESKALKLAKQKYGDSEVTAVRLVKKI